MFFFKHIQQVYTFLCVLCCICFFLSLAQAATRSSYQPKTDKISVLTTVEVPYSEIISSQEAEVLATVKARLEALGEISSLFSNVITVRFWREKDYFDQALFEALFQPVVNVRENKENKHVSASIILYSSLAMFEQKAKTLVKKAYYLELIAMVLADMHKKNQELSSVIETFSGDSHEQLSYMARNKNLHKLKSLVKSLEAWNKYLAVLNRFGGVWQAAALAELEQARNLDEENGFILLGIAEILLKQDKGGEALDLTNKILNLKPDFARALYVRGLIKLRMRLPALASMDFKQATEISSDRSEYWRASGVAYFMQSEIALMCKDFYQACTLGDCDGLAQAKNRGDCEGK